VAQHGYRTVATSHLHAFVKMGMGSQCGLLLLVGLMISKDSVTGMLSEVVKLAGMVAVGKLREIVSGSSDGSSGVSS